MQSDINENIFEKFIRVVSIILMAVGAAVLMLMMFLTAVDVACRYIMNNPISGALELVEYMMAILIPFSIAYCAFQRSHVAVELIFEKFPVKVQLVINLITTSLSTLFIFAIAWQGFFNIGETFTSKMTSAVLLIPSYPFVVPTAFGTCVFTLILVLHLTRIFKEAK